MAKALDVRRVQRIKAIQCGQSGGQLEIRTSDVADLSVEQLQLRQIAGLFEGIFGLSVVLETFGEG